tara:strand:+ start:486 stop:689 length:204 start_codon:yes stop_codon:yes gene_type:complete
MNEIEKIDYIYGAIKGTLWAIENDVNEMPIVELENALQLLKDLREPLFQELKKDIEGWDSMARALKK